MAPECVQLTWSHLLLKEADRASESGGSIILPLARSRTLGLNLARFGDQPQKVFPLPLTLRRRLGHDVGSVAVGGVLATFSLAVDVDSDVVRTEMEFDRRRRLAAAVFSGVAAATASTSTSARPKDLFSRANSISITVSTWQDLQDDSDLLQVVRKTGLASVSQDFTEWQREQREQSGVKWFLRRQQSQQTEKTDKITGSVSTENIIHRQKIVLTLKKQEKEDF